MRERLNRYILCLTVAFVLTGMLQILYLVFRDRTNSPEALQWTCLLLGIACAGLLISCWAYYRLKYGSRAADVAPTYG
jgi:protein-S-isoprenylcysteine O-methyltransferase Ste14